MKAIIPVAGQGACAHTHTQPKVLMNVAAKTISFLHPLSISKNSGSRRSCSALLLAEKVEEFVKERYGFRAHFVYQDEPMGNGHAIYVAREHLTEPTLIVFGDTIVEADLHAAVKPLRCRSACTTWTIRARSAWSRWTGTMHARRLGEAASPAPAVVGVYMITRVRFERGA